MRLRSALVLMFACLTSACHSGNVKASGDYGEIEPPAVAHPSFNPYAAYGEARAVWRPPVADLEGTIVKPDEPSSGRNRPSYEDAPWATGTGAGGGPAGTY